MEAKPDGCVSELKNELIEMLKGVVVPELSGIHEQYIYKVPPRIRQANPQAYTPQVISIGPFHSPHGSTSDNILHQMEQLKLKYLKGFLNRTNLSLDDLVSKFQEWENRIRNCYAGLFSFNSKDFLKIIIVDACFIIEHFLRFFRYKNWMQNDPILLKPWLLSDIKRDLVLLENQLPFFVLEDIYKLASLNLEFPSFLTISIYYFQQFNQQNMNSGRVQCPKHFTDLLRTFLLPSSFDFVQEELGDAIEHVYSVSQLSEAGLVFEASESKCLLDLNFDDKGVLKMPCFHVHDTTEIYMRNILAFEECHISDQDSCYISQYLSILDFLINTEKDVSILVDKKIIVNWMGDANAVAAMVNNLCKNVSMPTLNSKYISICYRLNGFYENPTNKYKAIFIHEYFNTPWKIASTVTAVLLLLFTLIQAVCSICSL
ncbi:UPF0481 protein At3g47200-like [Vicia villosa]|uniref:UPF0481 protein At3g47200-like n=1 Tax=Vicia villosa TaxID=3911 RepID=UPI00273C2855|nr:UPF0481 protein At3g47200-like [Vicia villosa]